MPGYGINLDHITHLSEEVWQGQVQLLELVQWAAHPVLHHPTLRGLLPVQDILQQLGAWQ
jgi:hypothetical protein